MHYRDCQKYMWDDEMGYAKVVESPIGSDEFRNFVGGFDAEISRMYSRMHEVDFEHGPEKMYDDCVVQHAVHRQHCSDHDVGKTYWSTNVCGSGCFLSSSCIAVGNARYQAWYLL